MYFEDHVGVVVNPKGEMKGYATESIDGGNEGLGRLKPPSTFLFLKYSLHVELNFVITISINENLIIIVS